MKTGTIILLVVIGLIVLLALYGVSVYNSLVVLKNRVKNAWAQIEVQLKNRADLIPNLVETVKGYVQHERNLLAEITGLRTKSLQAQAVGEKGAIESALSASIGHLLAVVEIYPDLKASRGFLELHRNLVEVEDQIQYARRYYNGTVRNFNTAVESFPNNVVAGLFSFSKAEFFVVDDVQDRQVPKVDLGDPS